MAFSTQKDFFHVPLMNKKIECDYRDECVRLKSYESIIDDRSWALLEGQQSRYLTDLVTCRKPASYLDMDSSENEKYVQIKYAPGAGGTSKRVSRSAILRGNSYKNVMGQQEIHKNRKRSKSVIAVTDASRSKPKYKRERSASSTSNNRTETSEDDVQSFRAVDGDTSERTSVNSRDADGEDRLRGGDQGDKIVKHDDSSVRESTSDVKLTERFQDEIQKGHISLERSSSDIVGFKHETTEHSDSFQDYRPRRDSDYLSEPTVSKDLRRRGGFDRNSSSNRKTNARNIEDSCGNRGNSALEDSSLIHVANNAMSRLEDVLQQKNDLEQKLAISQQRLSNAHDEREQLRERLRAFKRMEQKIIDLQEKARCHGDATEDLNENLCKQAKYIENMEDELKRTEQFYEEKIKTLTQNETCLRRRVCALKEELSIARCEAQKVEPMQREMAELCFEIKTLQAALNEYDIQYKQLMCVVEDLQNSNMANQSSTYYDELTHFTSTALLEIKKELEMRKLCGAGDGRELTDGHILEIETTVIQLKEEKNKLENNVVEIKSDCEKICGEALRKLQELQNENEELRRTRDECLKMNKDMSSLLDKHKGSLDGLKNKVIKLDGTVAESAKTAAKVEKTVEQSEVLVQEIINVREQNEKLSSAISVLKQDDELEALRKKLREALDELEKYKIDNNVLRENLKNMTESAELSKRALEKANERSPAQPIVVAESPKIVKSEPEVSKTKVEVKEKPPTEEKKPDTPKKEEKKPTETPAEVVPKSVSPAEGKPVPPKPVSPPEDTPIASKPVSAPEVKPVSPPEDKPVTPKPETPKPMTPKPVTPVEVKPVIPDQKPTLPQKISVEADKPVKQEASKPEKEPPIPNEFDVDPIPTPGRPSPTRKSPSPIPPSSRPGSPERVIPKKDKVDVETPKRKVDSPKKSTRRVSKVDKKNVNLVQNAGAYEDFVSQNALRMKTKVKHGASFERELRAILDSFISECGFCFCKDCIPKSRFYATCHKILHRGIQNVCFNDLVYVHKKIFKAIDKLQPGWILQTMLSDQLGPDGLKCCNCKNILCCTNSEEMLKEKVTKLERDIEMAREYLENLKSCPSNTNSTNSHFYDHEVTPMQRNSSYSLKSRFSKRKIMSY